GPQLRLGQDAGAEALERGDQRLDLVERVRPELRRVDGELEVDLVRAVGDPEPKARRRQPPAAELPVRRVLDVDADERAAVEGRPVQPRALVDARAPPGGDCVLRQVGHRAPPFDVSEEPAVVVAPPGVLEVIDNPTAPARRTKAAVVVRKTAFVSELRSASAPGAT